MILQDWYKDGKAYEFDMRRMFSDAGEYEHRDKILLREGYVPVYDRRLLSYPNTSAQGSVILENDPTCNPYLLKFQDDICKGWGIHDTKEQMTGFHPEHVPVLKECVKGKKVRNIIIDSAFNSMDQFRYVIVKCFADFVDVNFFINSHGRLIKILRDELKNNMDEYPVRNPHYVHQNGKQWFNELTFTIIKNNIYEIELDGYDGNVDYVTKIEFHNGYNECDVAYGQRQKYLYKGYQTDSSDSDVTCNRWKL